MKNPSKSLQTPEAVTPPVGVLARGLTILECFSEDHLHLELRELAQMTGLDKATLLRLLGTFIEYGYVQRSLDGKYAPGHNLLRLGALYRSTVDMGHRLQPILRAIMQETHESVAFYVREGDMRVCLYRENVSRDVRYVFEVGTRVPLSEGGSASHVLRAFTDGSSCRTEQVLKDGYALTRAERSPELASISVPVSEPHGRLLGAIQITGILNRQTEAQQIAAAQIAIRILAENGFDTRPTRYSGTAPL